MPCNSFEHQFLSSSLPGRSVRDAKFVDGASVGALAFNRLNVDRYAAFGLAGGQGGSIMRFHFILLIVALLGSPLPLHAAEISLHPDLKSHLRALKPIYDRWGQVYDEEYDYGEVHVIKYSGPVEKGDTAKLKSIVEGLPGYGSFFVVFNSPGGHFIEGIRLGNYLQSFRGGQDAPPLVGVAVLNGEGCYSACAVALTMAAAEEDAGYSARYIEVGGELGFHMPYFGGDLGDQLSAREETLNIAYDLVAEFSKIIAGGISPVELLQMSLNHRAASLFTLRGGLLSRYMGFAPVARGTLVHTVDADGLSIEHVTAMCANLHFTRSDLRLNWQDSEGFMFNFGQYSPWPKGTLLKDAIKIAGSPRLLSYLCAVEVRKDNSVGILAREFTEAECKGGIRKGDWCGAELNEYSGSLPDASIGQLANIFDCNLGNLTSEYHYWAYPLAFDQEERGIPPLQLDPVINTARNANLRAEPSTDSLVVGKLRQGSPVIILDCTVQQDNQGVWTKVETGQGTGWMSSRYLYDALNTRYLRRLPRQ